MNYDDQSPELKEALSSIKALNYAKDLDAAAIHAKHASAYALVSIAQSLERLAKLAELEEHRKRTTPEGIQ